MTKSLLLGAGSEHTKRLALPDDRDWDELVTCDINGDHPVDVVCDLDVVPWPFRDATFDEVHAYEVLEHLGGQGDWRAFFDQFYEVWRILRRGGLLFATVPTGSWIWGDPSHIRYIGPETLVFLSQAEYAKQVGRTPMSDFRFYWKGDFKPIHAQYSSDYTFEFVLRRIP